MTQLLMAVPGITYTMFETTVREFFGQLAGPARASHCPAHCLIPHTPPESAQTPVVATAPEAGRHDYQPLYDNWAALFTCSVVTWSLAKR